MRQVRGFTLIELLVTMSLLSMIVLICSSAIGLFSQRWDGQLGRFDMATRQARNLILVQNSLNSLIPYVVYSNSGKPGMYFEGNRNGFIGVSSSSAFSYGNYSVLRFSVRQNNDNSYDVLYEEWPMDDELLVSVTQQLSFSKPLVLFKSVSNPVFQYHGWESVSAREGKFDTINPPTWLPRFNGIAASLAPLKVSLEFETPDGQYQFISVVASEKPGLLSRYKSRLPSRSRDGLPNDGEADSDDCFC